MNRWNEFTKWEKFNRNKIANLSPQSPTIHTQNGLYTIFIWMQNCVKTFQMHCCDVVKIIWLTHSTHYMHTQQMHTHNTLIKSIERMQREIVIEFIHTLIEIYRWQIHRRVILHRAKFYHESVGPLGTIPNWILLLGIIALPRSGRNEEDSVK